MSALGSAPRDVDQLASLADISIKSTKKIIASLLFSGSLQQDSYAQLNTRIKRLPSTAQAADISLTDPQASALISTPTELTETFKGKQTAMEALLARRTRGEKTASAPSSSVTLSGSIATPEAASQTDRHQTNNHPRNNQPSAAQQEKRGFLSRLRQKLGL